MHLCALLLLWGRSIAMQGLLDETLFTAHSSSAGHGYLKVEFAERFLDSTYK